MSTEPSRRSWKKSVEVVTIILRNRWWKLCWTFHSSGGSPAPRCPQVFETSSMCTRLSTTSCRRSYEHRRGSPDLFQKRITESFAEHKVDVSIQDQYRRSISERIIEHIGDVAMPVFFLGGERLSRHCVSTFISVEVSALTRCC